jgi:dipeptidyl aminopeptidase/acylaminoacyl peptidase
MQTPFRTFGNCFAVLSVLGIASLSIAGAAVFEPVSTLVEACEALEGKTTAFSDVALSPDGRYLAWQATKGSARGEVFVLDRFSPKEAAHRIGVGSSPAWSPNSHQLAFLADPKGKGQEQLWVMDVTRRRPRLLTSLHGHLGRPTWSPEGKRLACLYIPGVGQGGPLAARAKQVGEIQSESHNQRLAVITVADGTWHFGSPEDLHVYAFDWSPDGRSFAATGAPGPGDNNWWIAQLFVTDVATGTASALYKPRWQIALPRWSPDGARIAFIEGLMSDEGWHGGDLMVVSAAGGQPRNLTANRPASPSGLAWRSANQLLFSESAGGGSAIAMVELASGDVSRLWQGEEELVIGGFVGNFALAADGLTSGFIRQDFSTPPEVWAGPIGQWQRVTASNGTLKAAWGKAESLTWMSDGHEVQGWLLHPRDERPGQQYPMIVRIHGGPSDCVKPEWDPSDSGLFPMAGYFLFRPNPRGSYGQGEAFTQGNVRDFGGGDLRDILAGVDKVLASHPVDPRRLGVKGWSYGGYMTMWAVTQSNRFAAAMAGAGTANYQSYYGENAIDQWLIPFFGASVYDDPAVYAKCSPIAFIKNVKTPTLILVGEQDAEAPPPQSFEFWHALKELGVPTKLVVYPGEGHMFANPVHLRDKAKRTLAWFDHYLMK